MTCKKNHVRHSTQPPGMLHLQITTFPLDTDTPTLYVLRLAHLDMSNMPVPTHSPDRNRPLDDDKVTGVSIKAENGISWPKR